ncbi:MAG: glycosyltransferase family 2 protein, partial [Patulibacter sp.]
MAVPTAPRPGRPGDPPAARPTRRGVYVAVVPDVVLPVLNEAQSLPWVLERMPIGYRAIVVDNGSTDDSARVALEHGAMVVAEPRRGFGSACFAGLEAADADVICFMDADGSLDPSDLPTVAGPLLGGSMASAIGAGRSDASESSPHV